VVKTTGKRNRAPIIILILLLLAVVSILSRSLLKHEDVHITHAPEQPFAPETPTVKPKQEPVEKPAEKGPAPQPEPVKIAVIIDDVGYPTHTFDGYIQFPGKLTFSVLPFQAESVHSAQLLHQKGFELMVHIPMEPLDYPDKQPGEGALMVTDDRDQVEEKLSRMIEEIPYIQGANNHMGSRATQNPELMFWTLTYLQRRGLYFVDSLTTSGSRAYEISLELDIQSTKRDVFLDNHDDFAYINGQFEELKRFAQARGTAVAIGHIHNENLLKVLNEQLPRLEEEGFELVFASEVVTN